LNVPFDQSLVLAVGVVLIAAVAGIVAWATANAARSQPDAVTQAPRRDPRLATAADSATRAGWPVSLRRGAPSMVTSGSARQVARVVAFLFLASVAMVVAITRAWPESEAAIFALIATGVLLVVLFMDMLPQDALGRWRHPTESLGAIVLLGLLMALTGGIGSPFVVGFYLVVAGTALSAEGMAPLAIALVAALTVAGVGVVTSGLGSIDAAGLAWIGVNAIGLVLVADLSAAAARAQRMARDEALRASRFDALTGLFNRAFFATAIEQEIRRSERMDRAFALLMLDLDDLKPVNDTFGHQWGDRLIRSVADVIRQTIRFTDSAARYGGDEFVVLLPETDAAGAYVVAETLRRDIAALTLRASDRNVRSSVSVGMVTYPQDGTTIEQLVAAADVAMYESKRRGKNQIVGYRTRTERVATAIDIAAAELVSHGPGSARTGGDAAPWSAPRSASVGGLEPPETPAPPRAEEPTPRSSRSALAAQPAGGPTPDAAAPSDAPPAWVTRPQPAAPDETLIGSTSGSIGLADDATPNGRATGDRRSHGRDASRSEEILRTLDHDTQRPWIALPIDQPGSIDPPEPPARPGRP
jgi:diguanylate cyclase (GGDEF)-like protein